MLAAHLLGCERQPTQASVRSEPRLVGLMEVAISAHAASARPRDAALLEVGLGEMRFAGEKVLGLEGGRLPDEAEPRPATLTPLRDAVREGESKGVILRIYGTVPFGTTLRALEALREAGVERLHFAVRSRDATAGWMTLPRFQIAEPGRPLHFTSPPLLWSRFTDRWREIYAACRGSRYVDCDPPRVNPPTSGQMRLRLFTRGHAMKLTFVRLIEGDAPPPPQPPRGGVPRIEGVPAPAAQRAQRRVPRLTEASFTLRHQDAVAAQSALTAIAHPLCGAEVCQAVVEADAQSATMRMLSMFGAVFVEGGTEPEVVFRLRE